MMAIIKQRAVYFALFFSSLISLKSFAQEKYIPKVGEIIQDYRFTDLLNYQQKSISLTELRGKWVVLDYWSVGCAGCVASFPKMNALMHRFKDKVEILMVGYYTKQKRSANNKVKQLYTDRIKSQNLQLPSAFDSLSFNQYGVWGVPFIMVIDPDGRLVAKTQGIDSVMLGGFISGRPTAYAPAYSEGEKKPDSSYNYLKNFFEQESTKYRLADTNFLFRSALGKWDRSMLEYNDYGFRKSSLTDIGRAEMFGFDLPHMLRVAYTGWDSWGQEDAKYSTMSQEVIFEVAEPKRFGLRDIATGQNMYFYSLVATGTDFDARRQRLLSDLETAFKIRTTLEVRPVKVWKIKVIDRAKLSKVISKSKALKLDVDKSKGVFSIRKYPVAHLNGILHNAVSLNEPHTSLPIILDDTKLDVNIDLDLPSYYVFNKNLDALHRVGLDLVKEILPMRCIVVRDAK